MISWEMIEREKYCNKENAAGLSGPSGRKPKAEIRDNQQDISFLPAKSKKKIIIGRNSYLSFNIKAKIIQFYHKNDSTLHAVDYRIGLC